MTDRQMDLLQRIEYHVAQTLLLVQQYRGGGALPPQSGSSRIAAPTAKRHVTGNVSSLRTWATWLQHNQPALRKTIQDATGIKLSTAAYPHMIEWSPEMRYWPDDAVEGDIVCRIRARSTGPGAPQVIFFLWSQRFDVLPLHGVGPTRPDPSEIIGMEPEPVPLLGVLSPTDENYSGDLMNLIGQATEETAEDLDWDADDETPPRAVSMDEWNERHSAYFDLLVQTETKPTEEERAELYADLPEGISDPHTIIAMAYRDAVVRDRNGATE